MKWPRCVSNEFGGFQRHQWKHDNSGNCARCGKHRNPMAKPMPLVTPETERKAYEEGRKNL